MVTNVTAIGSPGRAEHAIWGGFWLYAFWPIQVLLAVGDPLSDVGTVSCAS